jgi:hypothetical protein
MSASIFLAQLLGPMFVVVGIALLSTPQRVPNYLARIHRQRDLALSGRLYRLARRHRAGADAQCLGGGLAADYYPYRVGHARSGAHQHFPAAMDRGGGYCDPQATRYFLRGRRAYPDRRLDLELFRLRGVIVWHDRRLRRVRQLGLNIQKQ